jgi:tetratricopeptide (TPR) repeat protein
VWRQLQRKAGAQAFKSKIAGALEDGTVSLEELRSSFPEHKAFLDHSLDQPTDVNLLVGLPQVAGGDTKVALRNTGSVDATVEVSALLDNGERMSASTTIRPRDFGEVIFKTPVKVRRVEVDAEKLFPQTDFSDDVAPREFTDSDPLVAVKRSYDKQEFAAAEKAARLALGQYPRFDDVRILLARSLLAQNKLAEAEREFRNVLEERLPTARSIGWAYVGLADVAQRQGQNENAVRFATNAIRGEAEYGAALLARSIRNRAAPRSAADASITAFFDQWDKAAAANQKAQLDALVVPGEATRFSSGVAGQTAQWKTDVLGVDMIDPRVALVEADLSIKLLNREPESGKAVFRLVRSGTSWKILSVDVFEVR